MHYHIGNNMPGYLPTGDSPAPYFDTFGDAKQALMDDMLYAAEQAEIEATITDLTWAARKVGEATEDQLRETTLTLWAMAAGRVWWIQGCESEACDND